MLYVIAQYWPLLFPTLVLGMLVGWWFQSPRSVDHVTAWLEDGGDGR